MAAVARSSVGGLVPVFVGLYAWAASVSFGLVVADVAYAGSVRRSVDAATAAGIFSPIADVWLLASAVTLLAGLVALATAWSWRAPRGLILASIVLGTALLWLPVLLPAGLLESGAPLRLAIAGGVSVLAVLALGKLDRTR
jgi:hypothetical protein